MSWTILSILFALSMSYDIPKDSLTIQMKNEVIVLDSDSSTIVSASFVISNETENDWLFYGLNFNEVAHAFDTQEGYCDGIIVAGTTGFIFNVNNEQVFAEISVSPPVGIDYNPISWEMVQEKINQEKKRYAESKLVIKSGKSIQIEKSYDLKRYDLPKGTYHLFLIYHTGSNTIKNVGMENVEKDEKELNACLFQGCVKSNTVKLVVE